MRRSRHSYYSPYSSRRRINWRAVLVFVGIPVLIIAVVIGLNFNRIRLMTKGYSFSEASIVLKQSKDIKAELLSKDKVEYLEDWLALDLNAAYYDEYDRYYALHPDLSTEDVVTTMLSFMEKDYPELISLGYSDDAIWTILQNGDMDDVEYLIDNQYDLATVERFSKYQYFDYQKIGAYLTAAETAPSDEYAVNITNFPFIISTNETSDHYEIQDPENILALVKKGFYLPSDYVPSDLVVPNMPIAPECTDNQVCQEVATALEKMTNDAASAGMELVLNSGYRSYADQTSVYEETENTYGGIYASEYVATPGASEHQTGLGVDITSQSVVDGTRITFGDTEEYQWVIKNCTKYGFIIRFETESADITGIAHEPWHLRYVGEEVAKEIEKNGWTFEEYCLNTSTLPQIEVE